MNIAQKISSFLLAFLMLFSQVLLAGFPSVALGDNLPDVISDSTFNQCDLSTQTGWFGRYYNYSVDHEDMELPEENWGDSNGDPLSDKSSWQGDWYDSQYYRFARVDSNLVFGDDFFPFDPGVSPVAQSGELIDGHDYHFGSHWRAVVKPNTEGWYNFRIKSDDDSWVYLDGKLVLANDGVHAPKQDAGSMLLGTTTPHVVDIYFAERHTVWSHMSFTFITPGLKIIPYKGGDFCFQNEKPVITLIGDKNITLTEGDTFTDPGAEAFDPEDGDLTDDIVVTGTVDTNTPGTYTLKYNVEDSEGLPATEVVRTVIVEEDTSTPSTYSYTVSPTQLSFTVTQGDDNPEAKIVLVENTGNQAIHISVSDDKSWLTRSVSSLDLDPGYDDDFYVAITDTSLTPGVYTGKVTLYNSNAGKKYVYVTYTVLEAPVSNTAPTISLLGSNPLTLTEGDTFTDPGATANDAEDGDLTDDILVTGEVDTNTPGQYEITYSVEDSGGLSDEATRIVNVVEAPVENQAPAITLIGNNPLTLTEGDTFTDPGAEAFDPEDGDITDDIVVTGTVDTNTPDTYTLKYNVEDSEGLPATEVVRTVVVEESNGGGENMCLLLITPTGNDEAISVGDSFDVNERTLSEILDDNGYGSLDITNDQKGFETWLIQDGKEVTFEVKVLANEALYEDIVGIYSAGDLESFDALLKTGNVPVATDAPLTLVGESRMFTAGDGEKFGFAIKTYTNSEFVQTFATENLLNVDEQTDHAIVFEVEDGYVIAFEDLPSTWVNDYDYNDVVLLVRAISCADAPVENQAPTITLIGSNHLTLTEGDTFTDPGATANDPEDGDITDDIVVTGTVDTNTPDTYTLKYNVEDSEGLPATEVVRTVVVEESNGGGGGGNTGIDLEISKTSSVSTTTIGSIFTYTISVNNDGPENATGVEVTDVLPTEVSLVSASSTVGEYATSTGLWIVGDLSADSTEILVLTVTAIEAGQISNTATASSTGGKVDNDTENDGDTVVVIVSDDTGEETGIDLSISKTASVATTTAGSSFDYTISVTNNGPEEATGVEVTDILPAGVTLDSATTTAGTYATSTGIWTIGNMASSTSETLTLSVTVLENATGSIVNTATATSTDGNIDNNPGNDADSVTITIIDGNVGGETGIDLSVSKTASLSEVSEVGEEFTYTITVLNAGPETATNIEVVDELPSEVAFVSATTTKGTYATSTNTWTINELLDDESATLTITVSVVSIDNDIVNTATASADDDKEDNDTENNSGTSTVTIHEEEDNNNGGGGSGGGGTSGGGSGGTINYVGTGTGGSGNVVVDVPLKCEYLKEFMRYGYENDPVEVIKLQAFLNSFESESLSVDGDFDLATDQAVRRFQNKYFDEILKPWGHTDPTGYVYILTKKKVNEIFCNKAFPVTRAEAKEIEEFRSFLTSLQSHGIDTSDFEGTVTDVDSGLGEIEGEGDTEDIVLPGSEDREEDFEVSTTTVATSQLGTALKNLAAVALVFPADTGDAVGCLIVLLIILFIIYVLGTVVVNGMSENKPVDIIRSRKIVAFMVGVIIAIIIAFLVPYLCIIAPLVVILIVLIIWFLLRRKKGKPKEMSREFSL